MLVEKLLSDGKNILEISTNYSTGGISYWDGTRRSKGMRVSFQPTELTDRGGLSFIIGSGTSFHVIDISEYEETSPAEAFKELADLIGDSFDGINDVDRFVSEIRYGFSEA